MAHFNLKASLLGSPPPFTASDIEQFQLTAGSDRVRAINGAESVENKYWLAGKCHGFGWRG